MTTDCCKVTVVKVVYDQADHFTTFLLIDCHTCTDPTGVITIIEEHAKEIDNFQFYCSLIASFINN